MSSYQTGGLLPSAVSSSGHVELTTTVWTSGMRENLELSFKVRALFLEIYAVHIERMTLTLESSVVKPSPLFTIRRRFCICIQAFTYILNWNLSQDDTTHFYRLNVKP